MPSQKGLSAIHFFTRLKNHKSQKASEKDERRKALLEGRISYSNGVPLTENPYRGGNRSKESSWEEGWSNAQRERDAFLVKRRGQKEVSRDVQDRVLREGSLAFSNCVALSANPYANLDAQKAQHWESGWRAAYNGHGGIVLQKKSLARGLLDLLVLAVVLVILGIVGLLIAAPITKSDGYNKNREWKSGLDGEGLVIPEKFGYIGGLFHYDTLEAQTKGFLVRQHGILTDRVLTLPRERVKKVIFGSFMHQKYITIEYEDGIFDGSYRVFVNDEPNIKFVSMYIEYIVGKNRFMIEDNWN